MKASLASWILLSLASISQATSAPEKDITYGFATRDYLIEMKITFVDPYVGQRLTFSSSLDPGRELCFSAGDGRTGPCIERFVGAVAVVTYSVKLANGGTPSLVSIRERVTVSAQSPGLPQRAPFSMTQKLVKGIGSDLQVFGYDEGPLKKATRIPTRKQAQSTWWRLCKQELYVDEETKPFAIVEWKHTLNRVSIIQIYAPPNRE
jgi:hypothetical protein